MKLVSVEVIPYKSFKDKLKITKKLCGVIVEDLGKIIMVTKIREEKEKWSI